MRLGKTLKWTGILLGVAAVMGLAAAACWIWTTNSRLDRRLAALRAAGQPISLADLRGPPVPPETNAATYLAQARGDLRAIEIEILAACEGGGFDVSLPWEHQSEGALQATRAAIAAHPDVLPLLEKAADCPSYSIAQIADGAGPAADPDAVLKAIIDRVGDHRTAARLLANYRFGCLVAEGKRDEALKSCTTLLKLSRHFENEPALVGFLVNVACRAIAIESASRLLQSGPVSEDARKALDAELAKHDLVKAFGRALVSERAVCLDRFRAMPARMRLIGPYSDHEMQCCLDEIERFLDGAQQSAESASPTLTPPAKGVLASLLTPALEAAETAAKRTEARSRALRVLIALQRRAEPNRRPAADLSDLGLPKRATLDPFTGKPLVVKRVGGGWLIYSVGENLVDDGGALEKQEDSGIAPPEENPPKRG